MEITGSLGLDDMITDLKKLGGGHVDVGVFDGEMAMLARVHEFGQEIEVTDKMRGYLASQGLHLKKETTHIIIPERAPLRNTAADKDWAKEVEDEMSFSIMEMLEGKWTPVQVLERVGIQGANGVRDKITEGGGLPPPNHPFTIDKKGSSRTLVGKNAQLKDAYTHRVKK